MTRTTLQKQQALAQAVQAVKMLRHLTGNNSSVIEVQNALEGLRVLV